MNIKNLNQAIVLIAEKKDEIRNYDEADLGYEILQAEIDELRAELQKVYGSYLEEALFNIYDEYCPDNEVQPILAYISPDYKLDMKSQGVEVEADDFPGINALLTLVPNPVRFVLKGNKENFQEVVWSAREVSRA